MPELPEVETVCRGLSKELVNCGPIVDVQVNRFDLREPIQKDLSRKLKGQGIKAISRRAKYILIHLDHLCLVSHLGMSGSWRVDDGAPQRHDHATITFKNGKRIIYRDPRRFGILRYVAQSKLNQAKWFRHLGVEPLSDSFSAAYLRDKANRRAIPTKSFLMDQTVVVGIGNIYASEILFLAKIKPTRPVDSVKDMEWARIEENSRLVLSRAIENQGTTLRDYRQASGSMGNNQNELWVYGQVNRPCLKCGHTIRSKVIAGRSSFWCPDCQK